MTRGAVVRSGPSTDSGFGVVTYGQMSGPDDRFWVGSEEHALTLVTIEENFENSGGNERCETRSLHVVDL